MFEELDFSSDRNKRARDSYWVKVELGSFLKPSSAEKLFTELTKNEDVVSISTKNVKVQSFPDFGASNLNTKGLGDLCKNLRGSLDQTLLPVGCTPSIILFRRQELLWKRACLALSEFYRVDSLEKTLSRVSEDDSQTDGDAKGQENGEDGDMINNSEEEEKKSANEMLIETGVRTCLSVSFSLLRQSWAQCAWQRQLEEQVRLIGSPTVQLSLPSQTSLPNEILQSVLTIFHGLAPLTLSNPKTVSKLGLSCLEQSREFLQWVIGPISHVDWEGKRLALEILLVLAMQAGTLTSLLEWMSSCLVELSQCADDAGKLFLSIECCTKTVSDIYERSVSCVCIFCV